MGDWVDFAKVKSLVSIADVLAHYRIGELKKKGDELVGACPFSCGHSKTNKRSFSANTSKNNFQCFSCGLRGNVIDFVKLKESCSVRDAAFLLASWFNVDCGDGKEGGKTGLQTGCGKEEKEKVLRNGGDGLVGESKSSNDGLGVNPVLSFALRIDASHKYGMDRGLSLETINYFGCGFCLSKGLFGGRYVFPLHNQNSELVGYVGRAVDNNVEPKYLLPPIEKGFKKSHLLFNLHRVLADFSDSSFVVLVEGVFDTAKVYASGFPSVALLGSSVSDEQVRLLQKYFTRVIVLLDGDDKGKKAVGDIVVRLACSGLFVKAVSLEGGNDPGSLPASELQTILNEAIKIK